jgi:hypothetical protein
MATRSIVTSHPEIACDVCGRRLLRGEQSDVFLSGGQRRMVCELCVPRAAHEGWLRETEEGSLTMRPAGSRRTRSLLGRLRQLRESADPELSAADSPPIAVDERAYDGLYDFLDSPSSTAHAEPVAAAPRPAQPPASSEELSVARALQLFNGGEHPRRVAGVARSLGNPSVKVAPVADSERLVNVVVAWDLCWYRYQVNLDDERAGAQLLAQGMELDELPAEERLANAAADARGELSLLS